MATTPDKSQATRKRDYRQYVSWQLVHLLRSLKVVDDLTPIQMKLVESKSDLIAATINEDFDQWRDSEVQNAEDAILDEKMQTIDKMISDFIKSSWPDGDFLRASETKKPIDYDPLVRQIRDFARDNAYGNRILGRAIHVADKIIDTLNQSKKEQ